MSRAIVVPGADANGAAITYQGGWCTLWCDGTDFDSGTVTIQVARPGGTNWLTAIDTQGNDVTFTANGHVQIAYADGTQMRAVLSGSSGTTVVTCELTPAYADVKRRWEA